MSTQRQVHNNKSNEVIIMRKGVMRPGHVQIRVLDMDEAVKHYKDLLGLIEMDRDDQGRGI